MMKTKRYAFRLETMMVVVVACVITRNVSAQPVDVRFTRNTTTLFASVGRNEGTPDQFFSNWDPDQAFPGRRELGFGHGNRTYQLRFFDLEPISATREPGKRFVVTTAAFDTREGDQLQYNGGVELAPILVDWVSNIVPATWNNIVGSGSGVPGHGATVQQGQRINSTQFLFPASGPPSPDFLLMIEDWLNSTPASPCQTLGIPNYGFLVKATASSPSSVDKHLQWIFTFTYEQVPDPLCPVCGDGITEQGEECDDGGESVTCDVDCTAAFCGDGTQNITSGEECDDGNTTDGDGCSILCVVEEGFFCTGMPSICALDCNANSVPDDQDISSGTSSDFNANGIPDECEPDCQPNDIPDFLDIALGLSEDCNLDDVPDDCQLDDNDCDTDEIPDDCEPNSDGDEIIDACDNCVFDSNPDQADFDDDGMGDACDPDMDNDGVPNESDVCPFTALDAAVDAEGRSLGDIDEDCDTDLVDYGLFQQGFTGPRP